MTKDFSFRRLLLLIKKQWIENIKFYMYATLALIVVLGLVFLFWLNAGGNTYNEESLIIIFFLGLFLSGAIFANTSFNMLGSKAKGIYWLSFPASHLEKLICLIFYNLIIFTIIYCICFFLIEKPSITYIQDLVGRNPIKYTFHRIDWNDAHQQGRIIHVFYAFFAVQALYLLGSIYFRRYSFILTTITAAFVFFCFVLYVKNLGSIFSSDLQIILNKGLYASRHYMSNNYKKYELNITVSNMIIFLLQFIWAPFFWLVTWFRLKEKEV